MKDNNSKYAPKHIKIIRSGKSALLEDEWVFNYSDEQVFRSMKHLNEIHFNWVDKEKLYETECHMIGLQFKPICCTTPEFVNDDDLNILSKCIDGYFDTLRKIFDDLHAKIDWKYMQVNHRIKDADIAYYLEKETISSTLDILAGWMEILQI